MNDVIFREYDIRGVVGQELHIESVYALACAIAVYLVDKNPMMRCVVVGMDVRTHSPVIRDELVRGLLASGLDVVDIGMCSSPMVYYALRHCVVDAGIMVTASHNPKEYNGFKICLGTEMIHGHALQDIKHVYQQKKERTASAVHGTLSSHDIQSPYLMSLCSEFQHLVGMSLPVIFDCAHGSAAVIIPELVELMQWQNAQVLYAQPDGNFPHHPADPIIEENMRDLAAAVVHHHAVVGIGFDGDADRMGAVTQDGVLVSGDKLLALFAQHMLRSTKNFTVVYDINASQGLAQLLTTWGIASAMSPCGHAHIKDHMRRHNALLGGEISCHFFFEDRGAHADDGVYAALRLLEILHASPAALSDLVREFPTKVSSPRYRLACAEQDKQRLVDTVYAYCKQHPALNLLTMDGVRVSTAHGWGLVRASNTQAVLCFSFEADTQEALRHVQRVVADALAPVYAHNLYTTFGLEDNA
jgi:phosphomannomutase / phosphoglucomutase